MVSGRQQRTELIRTLDELGQLDGTQGTATAGRLLRRLTTDCLRVLVVGEEERGRGSLVEALVGRAAVLTNASTSTSISATVPVGSPEGVSGSVELIVAPPADSVYDGAQASQAWAAVDVVIVVLTADFPLSATERSRLTKAGQAAVPALVVLNKADRLGAEELAETVLVARSCVEAAYGRELAVYPVSAEIAMSGGGRDTLSALRWSAFMTAFHEKVPADHGRQLTDAVAAQAYHVISTLLDETRLLLRAHALRESGNGAQVRHFQAQLTRIRASRRNVTEAITEEVRRLSEETDAAARTQAQRLRVTIERSLDTRLSGDWQDLPTGELDEQGLAFLTRTVAEGTNSWCRRQAVRLQEAMHELARAAEAGQESQLTTVRAAARDLLDLDLRISAEPIEPDDNGWFAYSPPDTNSRPNLLAYVARGHLPGRLGRGHVSRHLSDLARDLTEQQVGRARSSLRHQLSEAAQNLSQALLRRVTACVASLEDALTEAAHIAALPKSQAATRLTAAERREKALGELAQRIQALRTRS